MDDDRWDEYRLPFPWFGGKTGIARQAWKRLGCPHRYLEPFCGGAGMLLARRGKGKSETINDKNGFVANFWRAVKWAPGKVADAADWPVSEADLLARHGSLSARAKGLADQLMLDPRYYDAEVAGWWAWGQCAWIGSGWCERSGSLKQLPDLERRGILTNRTRDSLDAYLGRLCERLRDVTVACGEWDRILSPSILNNRGQTVGIFLDPPYIGHETIYSGSGLTNDLRRGLARQVYDWAVEHGEQANLRIAYCCYFNPVLPCPKGWTELLWQPKQGYFGGKDKVEVIYFSPNCFSK